MGLLSWLFGGSNKPAVSNVARTSVCAPKPTPKPLPVKASRSPKSVDRSKLRRVRRGTYVVHVNEYDEVCDVWIDDSWLDVADIVDASLMSYLASQSSMNDTYTQDSYSPPTMSVSEFTPAADQSSSYTPAEPTPAVEQDSPTIDLSPAPTTQPSHDYGSSHSHSHDSGGSSYSHDSGSSYSHDSGSSHSYDSGSSGGGYDSGSSYSDSGGGSYDSGGGSCDCGGGGGCD